MNSEQLNFKKTPYGGWFIPPNSVIPNLTKIPAKSVIGRGSYIGKGCSLGEGSTVAKECCFDECFTAEKSSFGELCRFENNAKLVDCKFGDGTNFSFSCQFVNPEFGLLNKFFDRTSIVGGTYNKVKIKSFANVYNIDGANRLVTIIIDDKFNPWVNCGSFWGSFEQFKEVCTKKEYFTYIDVVELIIKKKVDKLKYE